MYFESGFVPLSRKAMTYVTAAHKGKRQTKNALPGLFNDIPGSINDAGALGGHLFET